MDTILREVMNWGVPMLVSAMIAGFFVLGLFFAMISNPPKAE